MTHFPCQIDGATGSVAVAADHLVAAGTSLAFVEMDAVTVDRHRVRLDMSDGRAVELSHLAARTDELVQTLRAARAAARRAALLQWTAGTPIDTFPTVIDGEPGQVVLFPDGLTVEPLNGTPSLAPLSLIDEVVRDGYRITLRLRGAPPVEISALGRRTDELLLDLDRARHDQATAVAAAYAATSVRLAGFTAPDGWAVTSAEAGPWWEPLCTAVRAAAGADDPDGAPEDEAAEPNPFDVLRDLAGPDLRLGLKLQGDAVLPFALAPVGDRVAVEGFGDDARATYVFRTDSVDQLNAVLLLTSFRREALYLPEDQLGRWALAARTLDVVRAARAALVARVVHTPSWAGSVAAALGAGTA